MKTPRPDELSVQHVRPDSRLAARTSNQSRIRRVSRRLNESDFPVSFAQQRLWFLEQLEGDLVAYNLPVVFRVTGPLELDSLRRAFETIVQRHEPLRTSFAVKDGVPVQRVRANEHFDLQLHDLSNLPAHRRDEEVANIRQEEADRPFDLMKDRMLRAVVIRLDHEVHLLLVTMHHIATDGWSFDILWRELEQAYAAYREGLDPSLPPLPVQYVDFTNWQREDLAKRLPRLVSYWRQQLDGQSNLELPTDRPRPSIPSYLGASYEFQLPARLTEQLRVLGRTQKATLHMVTLAAFQALLSRLAGQNDISVGMPVAGRSDADVEQSIGFFVNSLVLRTDLSGDPTFRELLQRVRDVSLAAYDHQDLPFEKLVEELSPVRQLDRSPLIQTSFQVMHLPGSGLQLADLDVSRLTNPSPRVRFDLEVQLRPQQDCIDGTILYATDLFDRATIERIAWQFQLLLTEIVANPDQPISEVPLLTESERHQLLTQWNDTARSYPDDECVHQIFEDQARRTPDAVAVVFEGSELTYRELNEKANRLANHLRQQGVMPGTLVGLCLPRSAELLVSILGILKAGGAYVPLDADYPHARLESMLQHAAIGHLVTMRASLSRLPQVECSVTFLDDDESALDSFDSSNLSIDVTADEFAYVMYTSGSSGAPKGVAVPHSAVVALVMGNEYATFDASRKFLQLASVSFDASTFEIWGALLHGGKLVIAPAGLPSPQELEELLRTEGVTTLWLTTTLFNQLVEYDPSVLRTLDEVLIGGEALSVRHICMAQAELGPDVQLINGYGPTENTTFTTAYRIPPQVSSEQHSIPIGKPIANTQVFVLDRNRNPVPIGIAGELYIGGAGLSRGYLNDAAETRERFVADPFSTQPDARLYRSGDRCRWRSDGNLEFLGRFDDQIKLRGYRIELSEIESALQEHAEVSRCVVTMREDHTGNPQLAAYCIPARKVAPRDSELRSHLRSRLPEYMLPAIFTTLQELPLSPNGKVDRSSLPVPEVSRSSQDTDFEAPSSSAEEKLAAIWREILGVEQVSVLDNFFDLGGHSLLALKLFLEIERIFGQSLPLAVLFRAPTIRQIARMLEEDSGSASWDTLVPIRPQGNRPPLFCVHGVGGNVVGFDNLARRLDEDQPVYGLQARGLDGESTPLTSVEAMSRHYVQEVRSLQPEGPYHLAGYSFGGLVAFEMAKQLQQSGQQVRLLALVDAGVTLAAESRIDHWQRVLQYQWHRLRYHVGTLLAVPSRHKLGYFSSKLRTLRRRRQQRHRQAAMREVRTNAGDEVQLPPALRNVADVCYMAAHNYKPEAYDGCAALFLPDRKFSLYGPAEAWSTLITGGVEVHQVSGEHSTILAEPHVGIVAEEIQRILDS